ncbi:hypothetical protein [Amycolatopsis sp. NPDC051061]|uniref:hypothetical protein n=1 Tax=Amycolatopsis sp. NPDC051061 TaxID=3155042 RepID=UPI0034382131
MTEHHSSVVCASSGFPGPQMTVGTEPSARVSTEASVKNDIARGAAAGDRTSHLGHRRHPGAGRVGPHRGQVDDRRQTHPGSGTLAQVSADHVVLLPRNAPHVHPRLRVSGQSEVLGSA